MWHGADYGKLEKQSFCFHWKSGRLDLLSGKLEDLMNFLESPSKSGKLEGMWDPALGLPPIFFFITAC